MCVKAAQYLSGVEYMTEYQRAVRMAALQPWNLLLRWHHAWNVFIYVEKEKMFERTRDCNTLCYDDVMVYGIKAWQE
jgi:hypothetical protein